MGEEQGCRCVSVSVCRYLQETECKCAEIMWYEGVWWLLELNRAGFCWCAKKIVDHTSLLGHSHVFT